LGKTDMLFSLFRKVRLSLQSRSNAILPIHWK
jgi:hypothetical protein